MLISVTNKVSPVAETTESQSAASANTSSLNAAYAAEAKKVQKNDERDHSDRSDDSKTRKKRKKTESSASGNPYAMMEAQLREHAVMKQFAIEAGAVGSVPGNAGRVHVEIPVRTGRGSAAKAHLSKMADNVGAGEHALDKAAIKLMEGASKEAHTATQTHTAAQPHMEARPVDDPASTGAPRPSTHQAPLAKPSPATAVPGQTTRAESATGRASAVNAKPNAADPSARDPRKPQAAHDTVAQPQVGQTTLAAVSADVRLRDPGQAGGSPQRAAANGQPSSVQVSEQPTPQGTSVHYSFKSWEGTPTVDLRFDPQRAEQVMTAHASNARVFDAMRQHEPTLPSDVTLRFERQQQRDDGQHSAGNREREQQEADEQ